MLEKEEIRNRIQRRIGLVFSIGCLIIALYNFLRSLSKIDPIPFMDVFFANILWLLILAIISFLTMGKEKKISRFVQIFLFFSVGAATMIVNGYSSFYGLGFIVYAVLLSNQYGYLQKYFVAKIFIILFFIYIIMGIS